MWKRLIAVVVGGLVLAALFIAWTAFRVKADLAAAEHHATALQGAVRNGDRAVARDELARLQEAASSARGRTDGPVFTVLSHLPSVGDDLAGVRTVSATLDDLA